MRALKTLILTLPLLAASVSSFAQSTTLLTPTNTTWRYLADGSDQGTAWTARGFDDSAWPQGVGLFGNDGPVYAPLGFNTIIPGLMPITVYYRTHFSWSGGFLGVILAGTNYVDDGSIIYLNGVEITRFNMPAGPAAFDTLAPAANPGGYPNLNQGEPVLVQLQISLDNLTNGNANPLRQGDNVIAVEVHQNSSTSSDRVFGLSLFGGQCIPPCTDGIQPTNRTILEGRSTTFIVDQSGNCGIPTLNAQWYRNVGFGEEAIPGAIATTYTLTNAMDIVDEGIYYCRLTRLGACSGTVDSRQAVLTVLEDGPTPPAFLSAIAVGPGLNTFRLITDEALCIDPLGLSCGHDATVGLFWAIFQSDDPEVELGVVTVEQINPTTYEFTTTFSRDPAKRYRITALDSGDGLTEISDLGGNRVSAGTFAETLFNRTFAQGVAGYVGIQDAEIHSQVLADTPLGTATVMKADLDDAGVAQSLLRFDNLFGNGTNRIPPGSRIITATLTLYQIDPGSAVNLHRMLVPWDQSTVTWNSLGNGLTANGVEAMVVVDATKAAGTPGSQIDLDVTASLLAWLNGQPNHGWALLPQGADGVTFATSEGTPPPLLSIDYELHGDVCVPAILLQPPASVVANELQPITLTVGVSNSFGIVFQWTKDGVDIPGANQTSYTIQSASALDSGTYRLRVSCEPDPATFVLSSPSVVTIGASFPPYLTGAAAESDGVTVRLRFSDPLNTASAQNLTNYTFAPPLGVVDAVLSGNNTVTLTTTLRELSPNYTVRVANVRDTSTLGTVISPNPTYVTLTTARVILPWTAGWLYNTNNLDGTPEWKAAAFVPGADWRSGTGLFGVETSTSVLAAAPTPIVTPLIPNNVAAESEQRVTTYFRRTIDLPPLPAGARYVIGHYTDDGFIAYLDGGEIHRFAMPAGAVTFTNRSTGIPSGEATMRSFSFSSTPGPHTLAVELHQVGVTSADVLFGMEVRMVGSAAPALSIAHRGDGSVSLNWGADNNWRLRGAAALAGPYLDVAIPGSSRMGTLVVPRASATSDHNFYRLDYLCRP